MNAASPARPGVLARIVALYFNGQFGRFLLAGGFAAIANFLSRFAFEPFLGFWGAVSAAYGVGFLTAFFLNRRFVFPASGKPLHHEMGWFFVFNALAFPIVLFGAIGLDDYVFSHILPPFFARAVSHGCAIILPVFVNFVAHKLVTFGKTPSGAPDR